MVHVIKVYFEDGKNLKQIRRLAVNSEVVGKFDLLVRKIKEIFPPLANRRFDVTWKDSENDVIHMSSDEELAQALANVDDGLLRIYVFTSDVQQPTIPKTTTDVNKSLETHPGVVCDVCEEIINGHRYKCLQCRNYDLCFSCNAANNHADHDMIKLVRPSYVRRDWVFLGARKLYRSMFGGSIPSFAQPSSKEKPTDPRRPTNDGPQWHTLVNDLLGPAEKIIKGNLENFINFVDNVAGVDVKAEGCPFKASSSQGEGKKNEPVKIDTSEKSCPEAKPFPLVREDIIEPVADKKTTEEFVIKSNADLNKETSSSSSESGAVFSFSTCSAVEEKQNKIGKQSEQSFTPYGLFCEVETSTNTDGWTLVHDHEAEENATCKTTEISGAEPKKEAIYPNINETLHSVETPKEEPEPEVPKQNDIITTQDPEILNALMKMQAMGFTNEGGWLERLLITKNGNINAALDALYPSARRL